MAKYYRLLKLWQWKGLPQQPLLHTDYGDPKVQALNTAIRHGNRVGINYLKSNGEYHHERPIRPRRLFRVAGFVYCEAFCELRYAQRHFRLDRILGICSAAVSVPTPPVFDKYDKQVPSQPAPSKGGLDWLWLILILAFLIAVALA